MGVDLIAPSAESDNFNTCGSRPVAALGRHHDVSSLPREHPRASPPRRKELKGLAARPGCARRQARSRDPPGADEDRPSPPVGRVRPRRTTARSRRPNTEGFYNYNQRRRRSTLDLISPTAFERQAAAA